MSTLHRSRSGDETDLRQGVRCLGRRGDAARAAVRSVALSRLRQATAGSDRPGKGDGEYMDGWMDAGYSVPT